jgi:hypothetical protein
MPKVVTEKYNVTLRNPETEEETITIMTQEVPGPSIEQTMGAVWAELGLELINKELVQTIEEAKVSPDEDGTVPDQSPENVQRRIIDNRQPTQHNPQAQPRRGGHVPPMQMPMNVPEKIIQHGDVRLKMVGDKVFIEEWVEKKADDGYKIISRDGETITDEVAILHKEWVELKEETPEPEPQEKVTPAIPANTLEEDTENFSKIVDDLI